TRPEVMTLQPLITSLNASQRGTNFPLVMTGAFLSSVPLLAVYLFFQKYFIRALSITSGIK
ncbi:MAG: carbohydrate ABC transporter permease, partial [Christensenellaceae bacterium]